MKSSFENLSEGLFLPNRKLMVAWGAPFSTYEHLADSAKEWDAYGHTDRYGQIHWQNEPLLPDTDGWQPSAGYTGGVIAYIRGTTETTIRSFSLTVRDDIWLKQEVFQYHAWMIGLIPILGTPAIDSSKLHFKNSIVPPCERRQGRVRVRLSYEFIKSEPCMHLDLFHDDYPLLD